MSNPMRRPRFSFTLILVVLALTTLPSAAGATSPHWYRNGVKIAEGLKIKIDTYSPSLTIVDNVEEFQVKCEVYDEGHVWNPIGGGKGLDDVTRFETEKCTVSGLGTECSVAVIAPVSELSSWATELEVTGTRTIDKIKKIVLKVELGSKCTRLANDAVIYEGELKPAFINGTTGSQEGCLKKTDSFDEFEEESGELTSSIKSKANIEGADCVWASEGIITVKNP
jgi:hypothetical protein